MLTGHGALRYGTSMWAVMWSCAAMAVDSTLSWLYRSQYVALVAPTSCFGVAVMSESEYMQKVPQEKLLLVIRATFFHAPRAPLALCSIALCSIALRCGNAISLAAGSVPPFPPQGFVYPPQVGAGRWACP